MGALFSGAAGEAGAGGSYEAGGESVGDVYQSGVEEGGSDQAVERAS